jgi:WD40 repeat protein
LWDAATGKERGRLANRPKDIDGVAFSADGRVLAVARDGDAIDVHDAVTGRLLRSFAGPGGRPTAVTLSPDGRTLACGRARQGAPSQDPLCLWDVRSGALLRQVDGGGGGVCGMAFSPDGKVLASALRDGAILTWDVAELSKGRPAAP